MTNKNKLENFEDLLLGKFLDPIHGVIRITKLEKKIIDHPLFQRLRDIRQNTFLYKVFPSAMHSRFEHSVGVMHLSYEILKNIDLNALIYNRKNMGIDLYLDIKKNAFKSYTGVTYCSIVTRCWAWPTCPPIR